MKKIGCVLGLVLAGIAAPALAADLKVGAIDFDAALMGSDAGKKWADSVNASLKPQRDKMADLKKSIEALELKKQKDQAIMSDTDKKGLDQDEANMVGQYQHLEQDGQRAFGQAREQFLERMGPKLQSAMDDLRKAGGYTLLLNKQAAYYVDPAFDLTQKVIDKLNAPASGAAAPAGK